MDTRANSTLDRIKDFLRANDDDDSEARSLIADAAAEIERLSDDLDEMAQENENLQERTDEEDASAADAVNALLDCVDRPVGTLAPVIPDTPASRRAIVALYDAVNRNL